MTQDSFPERFEVLFRLMLGPDGAPYTLTEIASQTGIRLNTLSRLKLGGISNPRLDTLITLGAFFDISLDYFACANREEGEAFIQQELARRDQLPKITRRLRGLSAEMAAELAQLVNCLDEVEASYPTLHDFAVIDMEAERKTDDYDPSVFAEVEAEEAEDSEVSEGS